jgi:hypothetical protein
MSPLSPMIASASFAAPLADRSPALLRSAAVVEPP